MPECIYGLSQGLRMDIMRWLVDNRHYGGYTLQDEDDKEEMLQDCLNAFSSDVYTDSEKPDTPDKDAYNFTKAAIEMLA